MAKLTVVAQDIVVEQIKYQASELVFSAMSAAKETILKKAIQEFEDELRKQIGNLLIDVTAMTNTYKQQCSKDGISVEFKVSVEWVH